MNTKGNRWYAALETVSPDIEAGGMSFIVTKEQKAYMEAHMDEVDDWCERTIGEIPHTVMFEAYAEDEYECYCYFNPVVD